MFPRYLETCNANILSMRLFHIHDYGPFFSPLFHPATVPYTSYTCESMYTLCAAN